jgi:hypothetical protein
MDSLNNRTALVTGASSGLGAEFARQLARRGCHLVLVARRADALARIASECESQGVTVTVISHDLSQTGAADALHSDVQSRHIDVDILVNNAGFGVHGYFMSQPLARINDMLALNVVTLTQLTQLFGRDMVARGHGHILQVGSVGSFQPGPLYGAYAATKAYVLSLGEALACELRGTGVTATVVCPGVTATEFLDSAGQDGKMSFYQKMVLMQADDVVRQGLEAMLAGRPAVVTGWLNKLQILALRLVSRRFAARAALWGMRLD